MDNIFKDNPDLKEYWKTADGTAFYSENSAKNHIKDAKLASGHVEHVTRPLEVVKEPSGQSELEKLLALQTKAETALEKAREALKTKALALENATTDAKKKSAQKALDNANIAVKAAEEALQTIDDQIAEKTAEVEKGDGGSGSEE